MSKINSDESTTTTIGLQTAQTKESTYHIETTLMSTTDIPRTSLSSTHDDPTSLPLVSSSSSHFTSTSCPLNMTKTPCDMLQPCQNDGTCNNANITRNGYLCLCQPGFHGDQCQNDDRPCKPDTCWNNGKRGNLHFHLENIYHLDYRRLLQRNIKHNLFVFVHCGLERYSLPEESRLFSKYALFKFGCLPVFTWKLFMRMSRWKLFWSTLRDHRSTNHRLQDNFQIIWLCCYYRNSLSRYVCNHHGCIEILFRY